MHHSGKQSSLMAVEQGFEIKETLLSFPCTGNNARSLENFHNPPN